MTIAAEVPSAPSGAPSGETPTGSAPASPSAPTNPPASSTPPAAAPTAPAAPRQYSYAEDRSNWVPPHRIRESSERIRQMERDLHLANSRVAALSGVKPPAAPTNPEHEEIRRQFLSIFPEYQELAGMLDDLKGLKERLGDFDPKTVASAQERQYEVLGNQTLARVHERATKLFGGELNPIAKQSLEMTFGAWIYNNPDLHGRYEMQDPKLIDEFFKAYQEGILDPFRRTSTTASAPRDNVVRRLPRAGSGAPTVPGQAPLKPADTDEYHGAAFRALEANR